MWRRIGGQNKVAAFRSNSCLMQGVRFDPDLLSPKLIANNWAKVVSFEGKNEYPVYMPVWSDKVKEWMNKSKL